MDNENYQKKGMRLVSGPALQVNPSIAKVLGLHRAIVMQQVHYWLEIAKENGKNHVEGHIWTYNSIRQWQEQFPFWSQNTVRRIFSGLVKDGFLITDRFNKMPQDRTLWYRIDYDVLKVHIPELEWSSMNESIMESTSLERCKVQQPLPNTSLNTCLDTKLKDSDLSEQAAKVNYGKKEDAIKSINMREYEIFFEESWAMYPRKEGKGKIKKDQKKKIMKFSEEFRRCISRYCKKIEKDRTPKKYIQAGSTFFMTGYIDYLDENYQNDSETEKRDSDNDLVVNMPIS